MLNMDDRSSRSTIISSDSNYFKNLFKKFDLIGIEKNGIDRILPEERTDSKLMNIAMIWIGANIGVPTFVMGTLGPSVFKLNLYDSFLTIILFNILGIIIISLISCFGPISGLRTMIFSRYSCGYYGASIISILNLISSICWASIISIIGGEVLSFVSNNKLSIYISIILINLISMIVSFIGYKLIHIYEKYSWIPVFIVFIIITIIIRNDFQYSKMIFLNDRKSLNLDVKYNIINFGASIFGSTVSWCTFACDYNTYFPSNTNKFKIFFLTFIGNVFSIIPLELLGASIYILTNKNLNWLNAYKENNVGGLLGSILLSSLGMFGKFLLTILSLSTIANIIPNIYSLSLSAQVISPKFKNIPRIYYTIIGTIVSIILAIVAVKNFNENLISFVDIISYFYSIYIPIIFEDHLLFRRCSFKNYNFNIWNNRKELPISIAAFLSSLFGIIGIILGMSHTWFTGPISKAFGNESYPNIGFPIGFIFTAITFPLFRSIELYFIKR